MRRSPIKHTKTIRTAGREYLYFVTGRTKPNGQPVMVRLPDPSTDGFWEKYGALVGAKTRAGQVAEQLTVPALARLYRASRKFTSLAAGSQRLYGIYLKHLETEYPTAPAAKMERKDIVWTADKMKPAAANSFVKTVNALYVWARKAGRVENDPCKDIDPNEIGEHDPWPDPLLAAALASDDAEMRLAIHLLLFTAQRIGDVCALRWTDIRGGAIFLTQEKTDKDLRIPVHSLLGAELANHKRSFETILSYKGKPLLQPTLRSRIKRFVKERGFVGFVPHGLRKNAVNALLECECSVAQTAAISGQSLAMVEKYSKRRNQAKLGDAAILKWERAQNGNG